MRSISRKRATKLGILLSVVVASVAFAYWTTSGSGTGNGSASSGAADVTVEQDTDLTAMYPGDSAQALEATVTNNADNKVKITGLTASIDEVTKAPGAPAGTCNASDFTLSDPAMTEGAAELAKGDEATFSGATIQFNNKANANQDACKGATVKLKYTVVSN